MAMTEDLSMGEVPKEFEAMRARVKPRLNEEEKLAKEVERRRQSELERRQRIFDAKVRAIGVDKKALDAQVAEKQQRKEAEAQENKILDTMLSGVNKTLTLMEQDKVRSRRQEEMECKQFSLSNLHYESRREFDLNDPLSKRKGIPARVSDEDPRCGPASMQKFGGEDLHREERIRQQRLAQANFVEQQKFEKAMLGRAHAGDDKAFAREVSEITELRNDIEASEKTLRKELQKQQQDDNMSRAAFRAEQVRRDRENVEDMNRRELQHHSTDPFLNEAAGHYLESGRVRRDAFKGSTRDERVNVKHQQFDQVNENADKKSRDMLEDQLFARQAEQTRKQLVTMEREKTRMRRELTAQMAMENKTLVTEQRQNTHKLNQSNLNTISPAFFEQFGASVR